MLELGEYFRRHAFGGRDRNTVEPHGLLYAALNVIRPDVTFPM